MSPVPWKDVEPEPETEKEVVTPEDLAEAHSYFTGPEYAHLSREERAEEVGIKARLIARSRLR